MRASHPESLETPAITVMIHRLQWHSAMQGPPLLRLRTLRAIGTAHCRVLR